jgi:hypothetical protein
VRTWSRTLWTGGRLIAARCWLSASPYRPFTRWASCSHCTRLSVSSCGDGVPGRVPGRSPAARHTPLPPRSAVSNRAATSAAASRTHPAAGRSPPSAPTGPAAPVAHRHVPAAPRTPHPAARTPARPTSTAVRRSGRGLSGARNSSVRCSRDGLVERR